MMMFPLVGEDPIPIKGAHYWVLHQRRGAESNSIQPGVLGTWAQVILRPDGLTTKCHLLLTLILGIWELTYLKMSQFISFFNLQNI